MSTLEVRIVQLDPMRVAAAHGFGESPEGIAFQKIEAFAASKGLLQEGKLSQTFGFNTPNPSHGSPNYGYEVWLPLDGDVEPEGDIEIKDIPGNLYAVARCHGLNNIGEIWSQLAMWREGSKYKHGNHQWLEHLLTPVDVPLEAYIFDLYLPITE